jgi:phospholipase/lecithinase/hemolysin
LLTVPGLNAVGRQIFSGNATSLPAGSVVSSAVASQITARVAALNSAITSLAQQNGAIVYDLNGFFSRAKSQGLRVGTRTLTADFQGGIYSLDGYYPGTTAHALIANEIIALLNKNFNTSFQSVDATALLNTDPAARYSPSGGRAFSMEELQAMFPQLSSAAEGDLQ